MAHIKCRYRKYKCEMCISDVMDGCFDEMYLYGECDHFEPTPNRPEVNPPCRYLKCIKCEFEKTIKQYELCESGFVIKGMALDTDYIDYLNIDGRVLIGDE